MKATTTTPIEVNYENGQLIWDGRPPVQTKQKVLITFLGETVEPKSILTGGAVRIGSLRGKVTVPDDFNEPLDDLKDYMY